MDRKTTGSTALFVIGCMLFAASGARTEAGNEGRGGSRDVANTVSKIYRVAGIAPPTAKDAVYYTGSVTVVTADNNSNFLFVVHQTPPGGDTIFTIKPTTPGGADMKSVVLAAYAAGRPVSVYSADAATALSVTITR